MAVSLAWGVLFATFITLLLVPCLYVMVEDYLFALARFRAYLRKQPPPEATDPLMQSQSGG
jgi:hypothetical protein